MKLKDIPEISGYGFIKGHRDFVQKGREAGQDGPWRFRVLQPENPPLVNMVVFDDEKTFKQTEGSPLFRVDPLIKWLGDKGVLLLEGQAHDEALKITREFATKMMQTRDSFKNRIQEVLPNAIKSGKDLAPVLRAELVRWSVQAVIDESSESANSELAFNKALKWLKRADSMALFLDTRLTRSLYPWQDFWPPWGNMDSTTRELARAWGYENDEWKDHAARAITAGVGDNPVAAALAVVEYLEENNLWDAFEKDGETIIRQVLLNDPAIPLIVRQAEEDMVLNGIEIPKGTGIAFDAAKLEDPFGKKGIHGCVGVHLNSIVIKEFVRIVKEHINNFKPVLGEYGRTRLTVGFKKLHFERRNSPLVHSLTMRPLLVA